MQFSMGWNENMDEIWHTNEIDDMITSHGILWTFLCVPFEWNNLPDGWKWILW
jgi:hypothetical protein